MNDSSSGPTAWQLIAGDGPRVIAHRGYCAIAPENTLPSFELALEAGARLVELDYHLSRDGVPVVIHDPTLDRTTDARKRWHKKGITVSDRTASEIQSLDAGSWFAPKFAGVRVPLLAEALEFIVERGGTPVIEHKSGEAEICVQLLRKQGLMNRVVVISFDWSYLRAFRKLEPEQILGALGPAVRLANGRRPSILWKRLSTAWLDTLPKSGANFVAWNRQISAKAIREANRRGLTVWVYTVDSPADAHRLRVRGVYGIVTNHYALLSNLV